MPEVERKFLIERDPTVAAERVEHIDQGYVAIDRDGTEVRVRRRGDRFTLTIKSGDVGLSRAEEELELDGERFDRLWRLSEGRRLEKDRHVIGLPDGLTAELDVYTGRLQGLRVVEVEFASEEDSRRFQPPAWFGPEITADERYRNRVLAVDGRPRD
jgi:CYTH domain-containing protein